MSDKQDEPESMNWIKFSIKSSDAVVIRWSDEEINKSLYYKIKARWGKDKSELEAKHKEVDLWVAWEYMSPDYKDQNPESVLWFASLSGDAVTEQLDERFFYGQNRKERKRFIIYHPPLRKPFQGRFRMAPVVYCIAQAADLIPKMKEIDLKGQTIVKRLYAFLLTAFGDHLRQFSSTSGTKAQVQQVSVVALASGEVDVAKEVVATDEDLIIPDEGVGALPVPVMETLDEIMKK